MRVLLTTIGSRGDVQPLVALALQLRALGQTVHLCVPPDFRDWIAGLGLSVTPIGPELRAMTAGRATSATAAPPSAERLQELAEASVAAQFRTVSEAARACDLIVGATALQIAAPSVAEHFRVPYIFVAICPAVLPSVHHAPPVLGVRGQTPALPSADRRELWARDAASFNATFLAPLNANRKALGLAPVSDVRTHIFTDRPWLAADPSLAPWPDPEDRAVYQTGAWLIADDRPLAYEIEDFLSKGEPPVYMGFGSLRATQDLSRVMVESARANGRRVIVSRGWADLALIDDGPDCLAIDEVNQQALFPRMAAVVHHGGAGTTTAAALAGAPQVIIPQMYDQFYFAQRVGELGVGVSHPPGAPTNVSLTAALAQALGDGVRSRATALAVRMRRDGARVAAERLVAERGSGASG